LGKSDLIANVILYILNTLNKKSF